MSCVAWRLCRPLHSFCEGSILRSSLKAVTFQHSVVLNRVTPYSECLDISQCYFQKRSVHTSLALFLKEIIKNVEGNKTVVEAQYVASPHEKYLIPNELADKKVCPLCALNLNIKHTDVLLLSQFVRPDGRILPRRVTGLCCSQQYKITMLITMAKKAGLMPNLAPANSHKDPAMRRGTKKLHRFFDETTIKDTRLKNISMYKKIGFFQ